MDRSDSSLPRVEAGGWNFCEDSHPELWHHPYSDAPDFWRQGEEINSTCTLPHQDMLQISFGTSQSTDQAVEMSRHMPAQHSLHRGVEVAGVAQQRPVHSGPVEAQHLEATCPLSSKQIEYPMQHALRSPHFHSTAATPEGETHMFRADSEPDWRRASQHSTYDSLRWPRQSAGSLTSMVPHHQPPHPAHEAAPSEWGFQQTGYGDLSGQYLQQNPSAQLRPLSELYPAESPDMIPQASDGSYVLANTTLAQSPVTVGSGGQTAISPAMQLACHQSHGQVETVSTWCVSGPVLDDAVGFFGSAQMAQHTVNYDRTSVSDSDGGHAPAGLHSSAVPAHRASDDLFDLAEGFTGAITLAPREQGEFRLSESGATRPRVNLKISPEVGRLAKCNAAGKRVRPQHLIDALEQQVFVLESSKAEMLRGIMVDEAAVDRKTGAMTAKSSEILEQKFASLALAADAGESLGSQSTGAIDCTDGWRTAYTAEPPGAAYTESVKYLSHLMTEYLKATGNRKGHLEDAIARNVSDVLRSLAECVRDMSGGSYASWIVSSTEENTQSRALEYPSHFIETVQMDAAQLAKLSMLVCFYMTSMDAMSIERATIVHELQNPEIPLYHMAAHDLQRHFLREDQLLQDMRKLDQAILQERYAFSHVFMTSVLSPCQAAVGILSSYPLHPDSWFLACALEREDLAPTAMQPPGMGNHYTSFKSRPR